jgi:hypothetical protein
MKGLLYLFCCLTVAATAQAPYLERRAGDNDFRRIDPFGLLPATINDPLPFRYGFSISSPVTATFEEADYFKSSFDQSWEYDFTRQLSYDARGFVREERQLDRYSGRITRQHVYERTEAGQLLSVNEYTCPGNSSRIQLTTRRILTYETNTGILLSDSAVSLITNTTTVNGVRIRRDENARLHVICVFSKEDRSLEHHGYFEFTYRGDSLHEIIQFMQDESGNKSYPVFRFYNFKGNLTEPFLISGYTSAWLENDQWKDCRIDNSYRYNNKNVYEGKLLAGSESGVVLQNELHFDQHGNVTSLSQLRGQGDKAETMGELQYDIHYSENSSAPTTIFTSYLDASGIYKKSLRVVVKERPTIEKSRLNSSLTVFPNPATTIVNLQWENSFGQELFFELLTTSGKKVVEFKTETTKGSSIKLPVDGLEPGVYHLRGTDGNTSAVVPLVILESK